MADLKALLEVGNKIISSTDSRALLCGRYTDGTPRNIIDAVNGEYLSPAQKKKKLEKKRSRVKNKTKGKKDVEFSYSYNDVKKKAKKKKKKKDKDKLDIGCFYF